VIHLNKKQFLKEVREELKELPKEDLESIMEDYEEHFEIGLSKGRTEEELAESLGDPKTIAKHAKAHFLVRRAEDKTSVSNFLRAIYATIALGFFNLIFVSGILLAASFLLFAFFLASGAIVFAGITSIVSPFIAPYIETLSLGGINPIAVFFFGIGLTAFGLLFFIANGYITRWFYNIIIKYLKMNVKIITGETK
jgi:uncharacterized membrane protein